MKRADKPTRRRHLCLAIVLVVVVLPFGVSALAPDGWVPQRVDPRALFAPGELASWQTLATKLRCVSLARTASLLALLILLTLSPLGKRLHRASDRLATYLSARTPLRGALTHRLTRGLTRIFGADWATALVFAYAFFALRLVTLLPFAVAGELLRQAAGLSRYTARAYLWDLVKAETLEAIVFAFLIFGLFGLIRRLPRFWWLFLGLPTSLLLFGYGVVAPYRARVFEDFHPLQAPALVSRLTVMAKHEGLELSSIKVVSASRTTRALNAYIAGTGPTRELVLFDNLVEAMPPDEVAAVVAHELGHHRREHPVLRTSVTALFLLLGLGLLAPLLAAGARRRGLDGPGDIRNLPLLFLLYALTMLGVRPISMAYSRFEERHADLAALEISDDPTAMERMFVRVGRRNQVDPAPPPWAVFWFASHPPLVERVGAIRAFAASAPRSDRSGKLRVGSSPALAPASVGEPVGAGAGDAPP